MAVLTALLVYFGWRRSEVHARGIGIDESILGMSTQDYLLRSVRSVASLLLVVALLGLLWFPFDRWIVRRIQHGDGGKRSVRWTIRALPAGVVALPVLVGLMGASRLFDGTPVVPVAIPLSYALGLLLVLYAFHLRQMLPGALPLSKGREAFLRLCVVAVAGIGVFTAVSNYAEVEGTALAEEFIDELPHLPRVLVYSPGDLHLDAPGVRRESLEGANSAYAFRYSGLRLIEHTGDRFFLVTDRWTHEQGTVIMLEENADVRLEFLRDNITITGASFVPADKAVSIDEAVAWVNDDAVPHAVVLRGGSPTVLEPGEAFMWHFPEPGRYRYFCSLHPDMTGTITVNP